MFDFKHVESAELAKQLRERHAVDTLQRLYAAFPSGLIRRGAAGTEPDFIVESEKKQVGVEVVEYFRPDIHEGLPVKAQEIFTAEVAAALTKLCSVAGLRNVSATLTFDYDVRLTKRDIPRLGRWLISELGRVAQGEIASYRVQHRQDLPVGVSEVWAHHRPWADDPYIGVSWGGVVRPASEYALSQLIARKERKLAQIYHESCSEVWLLVLVDPYNVASVAYVAPDYRLTRSTLARVIALQGWNGAIELWNAAALCSSRRGPLVARRFRASFVAGCEASCILPSGTGRAAERVVR